jgi:hypothetical protein
MYKKHSDEDTLKGESRKIKVLWKGMRKDPINKNFEKL